MNEKQRGKDINPANLQEFLDTSANATEGQMQFFTDPEIAKCLAMPLVPRRQYHAAVDLQMGRGDLLRSIHTQHKLGIDIDATGARKPKNADGDWMAYQADCHQWYDLACQVNFMADLYTLNPPYGLKWYTERVKDLAQSTCPAVRDLWEHVTQGRTVIDSTLATLMMALDRSTAYGEGYLIMNGDTFDKWLAKGLEEEVWAQFLRHVWAQMRIPGPVWQNQLSAFPTTVLYFCKTKCSRMVAKPPTFEADSHARDSILTACSTLKEKRGNLFPGRAAIYPCRETPKKWEAIEKEIKRLRGAEQSNRQQYNVYLDQDGAIQRYLTSFEQLTGKIPAKLLRKLDDLKGKRPMQLVVQTATRKALFEACHHPAWRVDPAVLTAIQEAVDEYESVRAPFFQPNPIQALGWIDEVDRIKCLQDIPGTRFCAGQSYPLSTKTERTEWNAQKTNAEGKKDALRMHGSELAVIIYESQNPDEIKDDNGDPLAQHVFHVRESAQERDEAYPNDTTFVKHHHVSTLVNHFEVPQPKDVAQVYPERYAAALENLTIVEDFISRNLNAPAA